MLTEHDPVRVELPRDRDGSFAPLLIPKHGRRFTGFDDRIIAIYARGMSVREIQPFLAESYATEVSRDFISSVTDEVMAEAMAWQNRGPEAMCPMVCFDAPRVKIRDEGGVSNNAMYLALCVQADGQRDVLGLWVEQAEGAKFWLKVFNELKPRGGQDILFAVVDGLKGLADAIGTRTTVQTCIVYLIRNSLDYAGWEDHRKAGDAASTQAAEQAQRTFADGPLGGQAKPPRIRAAWQRAWENVTPFFVLLPASSFVDPSSRPVDTASQPSDIASHHVDEAPRPVDVTSRATYLKRESRQNRQFVYANNIRQCGLGAGFRQRDVFFVGQKKRTRHGKNKNKSKR